MVALTGVLVLRTQILVKNNNLNHKIWEPIDTFDKHWYKYGEDLYVINRMPLHNIEYTNKVLESLYRHIERTGEYVDETVFSHEWYDTNVLVKEYADPFQDPIFIFDIPESVQDINNFDWICKRIKENRGQYDERIDVIFESWLLKEGVTRDSYNAFYHLSNGETVTSEQFKELYE